MAAEMPNERGGSVSKSVRARRREGRPQRGGLEVADRPGSLRAPWSLADAVGAIVAGSMVVWWPWPSSTSPLVVLTILTTGSFALLPWSVRRWRSGLRPCGLAWIPTVAAGGLVVWSLVSMIFSGAPWPVSLYGWENRNDGVLALLGVAILLATAASLRPREIDRIISWMLLGGAILVVEALLQFAGWTAFNTSEIDGVWAAMGNPNFLAAVCGLLSALALARSLDSRYSLLQRLWTIGLLAGLVAVSLLTVSVQGPVTLLIAVLSVLGLRLLQWQSPRRLWAAVALAVSVVAAAAVSLSGLVGLGPLASLWAGETIAFRKSFWLVSWRVAEGLPLFGTGPGGLARYVGEYRSAQYIAEQGPDIYIDAAHNLPLQYAATTGLPGLLFACALLVGAASLVVLVAWQRDGAAWVISGVGGALFVYVAQGLISIDELRLKELGWITIGLTIALTRGGNLPDGGSDTLVRATHERWWAASSAAVGFLICLPALLAVAGQSNVQLVADAEQLSTNTLLPCSRRMSLVTGVAEVRDLEATWSLARQVADLDLRCPGLAASYAELAVLSGDIDRGFSLAQLAVTQDPLNARAWLALSQASSERGDLDLSGQALARADELQKIRPIPNWDTLRSPVVTD